MYSCFQLQCLFICNHVYLIRTIKRARLFLRFLRSVAYREFIFMVHGYLGDERRALPACAYNAIRSTFNDEKEQFKGFDDETA